MNKQTQIGMELLRSLSKQGDRIFPVERARILAETLNIKSSYLNELLFHLKENHWIHPLKKGLYALDSSMLAGTPIHEYEIGTSLVNPAIISHFSAFHYHELTDQIPHVIYISTPKLLGDFGLLREINGVKYRFIQSKPVYFFGDVKIWVGEARISISDLERTLLDGLRHPYFCGGFSEVLQAYKEAKNRIELSKVIDYAFRLETSTIKRLGWILDHIGIAKKLLYQLEEAPIKGFRKLDAKGEDFGSYNRKWMIRENL